MNLQDAEEKNLVFMKTPESGPSIHCLSPLERNDHVAVEIVPQEETVAQELTI